MYAEGGAKVKTTVSASAEACRHRCKSSALTAATRSNHIQLIMPRVSIREGDAYVLGFRVRCTKPFAIPQAALMKQAAPWTSYGEGGSSPIEVGADWTEQ